MLWEVEIQARHRDAERERVVEEFDLLTHSHQGKTLIARTARGYLLEGDLSREQVEQLARELLVDPVAEVGRVSDLSAAASNGPVLLVLRKPGVMDPAAISVVQAARDLGISVVSARSLRRYYLNPRMAGGAGALPALRRVLANDAIEQIIEGSLTTAHWSLGTPYVFRRVIVPLRSLDDSGLEHLSRQGQLSLNRAEMRAIQAHFRELGRDATDVELETLAQTWSEHCSHKTLKGEIDYDGRRIHNLLKETIFAATARIRRELGADDWCVSVFEDNAGVVRFDERYHVCFKVETHNHPSALEPYGGANTGLGGVIRDPLGTGLGAKPVCNTDVFCFAPPDTEPEALPAGVLHPRKVMKGVVAGVRDYGNRMGIATVNGTVLFDERYLGNPLVFCGTVGILPANCCHKEAKAGDLVVVVGGRTGRDGIHGATFSSTELTSESEQVSGGAVQIGNAITEKKLVDVLVQARDRGLYDAITDCGAGGFSSAIGEMAEKIGARVDLDKAPLKYEGLSYTEIWISEAQERMVLAVPPAHWPELQALCAAEDVEASAIGSFEATGRLRLYYHDQQVADLELRFLHGGRPAVVRRAIRPDKKAVTPTPKSSAGAVNFTADLLRILSSWNVCSKEWIIRQYDHEVQGVSAIKPLVGIYNDGPGDAAVVTPVLGSSTGLAIGCGINPRYGDLDPYRMAASAIDEAVRNVVAVGADPARIALLDNFCWGNTERPEVLGSLVEAAQACHDVGLAYQMPFISGKDSLNNEFHAGGRHIVIPPTLLISAIGRVPDIRLCVTMDFKEPDNALFLVGATRDEMGGSHYHLIHGLDGGEPPGVQTENGPLVYRAIHRAMQLGLIRSCHDLSEGGLAVAIAEMAFAGGLGADVDRLADTGNFTDEILLFAESNQRFIVEVRPADIEAFRSCLTDVPVTLIGQTCQSSRLRIAGRSGEWNVWANLNDLKKAWQSDSEKLPQG